MTVLCGSLRITPTRLSLALSRSSLDRLLQGPVQEWGYPRSPHSGDVLGFRLITFGKSRSTTERSFAMRHTKLMIATFLTTAAVLGTSGVVAAAPRQPARGHTGSSVFSPGGSMGYTCSGGLCICEGKEDCDEMFDEQDCLYSGDLGDSDGYCWLIPAHPAPPSDGPPLRQGPVVAVEHVATSR